MKRHLAYLKYVLRHKWHVFHECLKLGVPIWIAVLHDWDKFLPDEWVPYARTFYTPDGTKQYVESVDFARAWMKHQHRNKHHWQRWITVGAGTPLHKTDILIWDRGNAQMVIDTLLVDVNQLQLTPFPMPDLWRREMLADWRGAGKALGFPDTKAWYEKNKDKMRVHPETRAWIEEQLGVAK